MADFLTIIIGLMVVGCGGVIAVAVFMRKNVNSNPKPDKKKQKALKKLDDIKKGSGPIPGPAPIPVQAKKGTKEEQGAITSLQELPIDAKLEVWFTRAIESTNKRIVVAKGRIQMKAGRFSKDLRKLLFVVLPQGTYYVNPKLITKITDESGKISFRLIYDVLYSELLEQDGTVQYDEELEQILTDSAMDQYVTIAAFQGGFTLTPTLKRIMLIIGGLGFFIGLALNGSNHIIPVTIIHWLP